ncbi:hypothetical protein [Novosphingobium album (ex Hu et al. 2023)]|uniref:Uncharacterized protein n=1 Tax=Novosphingobium album (ex Hu et al. 2023) TaxID=2930093 RepID=A0ABT0AZE1_9SPHN|nr:hypothetical protein [Novosphingobium album (ex Hu et al. 2023)]MCJ2177914.1 hypothetical protein [Novosphingobium album (ex Hu et al. 2023)]
MKELILLAGPRAEFLHHAERPWSSTTFSGSRHTVTLVFSGADGMQQGQAYVCALPDHEFTISGQLVADAAITSVTRATTPASRMTVEAELLLLDDV